MLVRKEIGGVTLNHAGKRYTWKADGDSVKVPDDWGAELIAIRGGGFSEVLADAPPAEVSEPAPAAKAPVTEPSPKAAAPVTGAKPAAAAK